MKSKKLLGIFLLVTIIVLVAAFILTKQQLSTTTGKLNVTTSYYPLYDFAKAVGGDKVTVTNITPAGSEPHDYAPSPKQLVDAAKADVFIYNGTGMEQWVTRFLPDYSHITVKASTNIALRHGEGNTIDPHFWIDPVLARQIVKNILAGLVKADPTNKEYYTARAAAYSDKLHALDGEFRTGLATCSGRTIIVSHNAFSYLAARYNLTAQPIAGLSPDEEPSAAKLAELSRLVTEKRINYIFFESLASPKLAATIATETGAKTAVLDPIEGLTEKDQTQGKNYISVQQQNLKNLQTALGCN